MRTALALVLLLTAAYATAEPHGFMKYPDIEGESPQSQIRVEPHRAQNTDGPLYPGGWALRAGDDGGSRTGALQPVAPEHRETDHAIDQSSPYLAW